MSKDGTQQAARNTDSSGRSVHECGGDNVPSCVSGILYWCSCVNRHLDHYTVQLTQGIELAMALTADSAPAG